MKTTTVMLGIVAAAAAGVAIGMLIAPEKGTDLQKRLKEGAKDWLDEISRLVNDRRQQLAGAPSPQEEKAQRDVSNN